MRRSLIHYWRLNLAVILGAAVATAVFTGALLVGDSVRGSLRALTLERLGEIDHALVSASLFRQNLAEELSRQPKFSEQFEHAVPALLLTGSATHAASKARASGVNICGIDRRFVELFATTTGDSLTPHLARKSGQAFQSLVINEALARELNAKAGDQILLSFKSHNEIPQASWLGKKETAEVLELVRLTVTAIVPDRGVGSFGLRSQQYLPFNAFVALPVLQRVIGAEEKVNALFVSAKAEISDTLQTAALMSMFHQALRFEDLGLRSQDHTNFFSLTSRELILKPALVATATTIANELQVPSQNILTYLANTMRLNDRIVPYSTITALDTPVNPSFGSLTSPSGETAPALAEDEILLNDWAAKELAAEIGDTIRVSYFVVGEREQLVTAHHDFHVRGIIAMSGLGADRDLTPPIPGVENVEDMREWEPPFPVELALIRSQDEHYWDEFRATPKAFVSLNTGQRLWRSRFGEVNAMRFGTAPGLDLQTTRAEFEKRLLEKIAPAQAGYIFQPVKAEGLQAAAGATDFGMLFIGFSLFLIVSAALLVGLLFRLGVEQRAPEIGMLLAVGYPLRAVRWRLLREGLIIAALGVLLGLAGAVGYAGLMMAALRTWWVAAVGTSFLFLHVNILSLLVGALCAFALIAFSIWWTVRQLGKIPATALLQGVTAHDRIAPARFSRALAFFALVLAGIMLATALVFSAQTSAGLFFGSGALLVIAGLAFFSLWLRRGRGQMKIAGRWLMAARNSGRHPGRSMLSTALVCCACFVIVAVAASRREIGHEALHRQSGTGGFALMAETEVPLPHDLNTSSGRAELGFSEADSALLNAAQIFPVRLLPGEDASCLNLYQPQKPRVLGVSRAQIARGGFQFQTTIDGSEQNPWQLLERELEPGVIPAFGDYNSVQWILHLGLGKDLVRQSELGNEIKLRFVGLLQSSIFQSEIIISEENFLKHFPSQSGYAFFLIDTPADSAARLSQVLESTLNAYGCDAVSTLEKLANFQAVENTYLSVFQTLGGLGLLLGTLGLGIILTRNLIERRGELATLRAFGFRRATLSTMLVAENGFLVLWGIVIGGLSALLAVAPHLFSTGAQVPWLSLALTLLLVLVTGLLASVVAVAFSLRIPLLPALKGE